MYHFYTENTNISENEIAIYGDDVNHIKNVLRMQPGEEIVICDGEGTDYHCRLSLLDKDRVVASILDFGLSEAEMKCRITLFQGLPKKDKMEMIIQKAVELGVYRIVPVMTKRVIVKLDDPKKEARKLERWQAIAESAAKQCGRGIIPEICPILNYKEALIEARELEASVIPYENADSSSEGMKKSRAILEKMCNAHSGSIFIGPEGGFEPGEVELAIQNGVVPISLGRRILRTETAGLMVLSVAGFLED